MSLFSPLAMWFQGLNSNCQPRQQVPLLTEPSACLYKNVCVRVRVHTRRLAYSCAVMREEVKGYPLCLCLTVCSCVIKLVGSPASQGFSASTFHLATGVLGLKAEVHVWIVCGCWGSKGPHTDRASTSLSPATTSLADQG